MRVGSSGSLFAQSDGQLSGGEGRLSGQEGQSRKRTTVTLGCPREHALLCVCVCGGTTIRRAGDKLC